MLRKTVLIIGIIFFTFGFCSKVLARPRGGPARGNQSVYKARKYSNQGMKIQDKKGDRQRHPISGAQGFRHKSKAEQLHQLREQKMDKPKGDFRERRYHKGDHMSDYREYQRDKRDYLHQEHQDLRERREAREERRQDYREHKEYLDDGYRDLKEKPHDMRERREYIKDRLHKEGFPPKRIEYRRPGQGRGPHSGHDRGLHRGESRGVRDHGKGVGRVKEQGFMRGQGRKYRQGPRRDFPKQGGNKGPQRGRR
ncbi:MAG: hypothetical protein NG737_00730 [Omnitrophica bacterium]|nr:hypothetical protein [Candidatus Omnitrophota bacterium]